MNCQAHTPLIEVGLPQQLLCSVVLHGYDDSGTRSIHEINPMHRPTLQWSWSGGQASGQTGTGVVITWELGEPRPTAIFRYPK